VIKNFIGTKSWRNILEKLKQKFNIFIRKINIFNPKFNNRIYLKHLFKALKTIFVRVGFILEINKENCFSDIE